MNIYKCGTPISLPSSNEVIHMDLFNKSLNIILPPIALLLLSLLYPIFLTFNAFSYIKRCQHVENVAGKVVLITGASSGIGEHLAYEYASRGARLALVARREDRLRAVAQKSRALGSPDVIVIRADVSKVEDCKRFVEETINHFGQLDHLVNNAGIVEIKLFEDYREVSDTHTVMDTNFWGSVHPTHAAIPVIKKNKGKIVVIASPAGWFCPPKMIIYGASKAAMIRFFDTLRIELGSEIGGITIVTPGLIQSESSTPENVEEAGAGYVRAESASSCAKAIVDGVCCGRKHLSEPSWIGVTFWLSTLMPEVYHWAYRSNQKNKDA